MSGEGCGLVVTESQNLFVCTGNDSSPENSSKLVRVCDANGTLVGYRVTPTPVLAIRMWKPEKESGKQDEASEANTAIIIVTQLKIYIYDSSLANCNTIIDTESNPHGAIAVSSQEPLRIAYPCPSARGIKISTINGEESVLFHGTFSSPIQVMAFSPSGRHVAATDQDGLTVYSFTLPDASQNIAAQTKYYRRGTQRCTMTSLCYSSKDEDVLCCSSNHGTIHVFNINPSSSFIAMPGTVQWNFQIKDDHTKQPSPPHHGHRNSVGHTNQPSLSPSSTAASFTSWCHFSKDATHLYRVADSRVYIYSLDLAQQRSSLLLAKELLPPSATSTAMRK